jgi:apolipoprotein N-acyltransferase
MLAAIRSAEMGVPMIRLATTGITTTVDALGRLDERSPLFEQRILNHSIPLVYLPTLYSRIGDLFVWICVAVLLTLWGLPVIKKIKNRH